MREERRNQAGPAGVGHPAVRQYLDVKQRRRRVRPDTVTIERLFLIRHALAVNVVFDCLFVCRALIRGTDATQAVDLVVERGLPVYEVSERVIARMVDRDGPDGLAAVVRLPARRLVEITLEPGSRVVVADGLEAPGNLGTLIRCADGAGAAAVVVTERGTRIAHQQVVRGSMGAIFSTPTIEARRADTLAWLRANACRIIAAHPDAPTSYLDADYEGNVAIVLGRERDGLDPYWHVHADVEVSIPMLGRADSLNVGNAAALLLYEALRAARRDL